MCRRACLSTNANACAYGYSSVLQTKSIDLSKLIHSEPPFPSPHLTEPVSREALMEVERVKELQEMQQELSSAKGYDDFAGSASILLLPFRSICIADALFSSHKNFRTLTVQSKWKGTGLVRNPWRNNPQFKARPPPLVALAITLALIHIVPP